MDEDFVLPEGWYQLPPDSIIYEGDRFYTYNDVSPPPEGYPAVSSLGKTVTLAQQGFAREQRPVIFIRRRRYTANPYTVNHTTWSSMLDHVTVFNNTNNASSPAASVYWTASSPTMTDSYGTTGYTISIPFSNTSS